MLRDDLIFLGMSAADRDPKANPLAKQDYNRKLRKLLQVQFESDYQQALVQIKDKYASSASGR